MSARISLKNLRLLLLGCLALGLAACGGGGGGGGGTSSGGGTGGGSGGAGGGSGGGTGGGSSGGGTPPVQVEVSGLVEFELVVVGAGGPPTGGLRHSDSTFEPARLVTVEFISDGQIEASTSTGIDGRYSLMLPVNTTGFLRVKAESVRTGNPSWDFRVVDNTDSNSLYTIEGAQFSTGTADSTRDFRAESGWTGDAYTEPRSAAPFAILDAIYQGAEFVLTAEPTLDFPPLLLHWSPNNTLVDGDTDVTTGELGSTFYRRGVGIYLLGDELVDTDEYDRHVILHEFHHYLEFTLWRSDSLGGGHAFEDILDMRLAFSEAFSNAFSAMSQDDRFYRDSFVFDIDGDGEGESVAGWADFEGDQPSGPFQEGWFSERSIHELVWDYFDTAIDGNDTITIDYTTMFGVLRDNFADLRVRTSLFPFINLLKAAVPGEAAAIDAHLGGQSIAPIDNDYGTGQTNAAGAGNSGDVLPVYTELTLNGPAANVCSTDEFTSSTGGWNKLGARRFLRFSVPSAMTVSIVATATEIPADNYADPDFFVHDGGQLVRTLGGAIGAEGSPTPECQDFNAGGWSPAECVEASNFSLPAANEYIVEIYEWTNSDPNLPEEFTPIGRTCFDVLVMQ